MKILLDLILKKTALELKDGYLKWEGDEYMISYEPDMLQFKTSENTYYQVDPGYTLRTIAGTLLYQTRDPEEMATYISGLCIGLHNY